MKIILTASLKPVLYFCNVVLYLAVSVTGEGC